VQVEAFSRAVLEGREVPIPPADAVANMRVIDRVLAAGLAGA
jgi:predicted dehydrogenase